MFKSKRAQLSAILISFLFSACKPSQRDQNWHPNASQKMVEWFASLQYQGYKGTKPYKLEFPEWFINREIPETHLTVEAVELGRFLFYDKALSSDSSISCASCHRQQFNFADNKRISPGVKGRLSKRNAMQLVNLIFDHRFFWDGRAPSLEAQILGPIQGANEMDLPIDELAQRLSKHPVYPALFERAYGTKKINKDNITNALAQFVSSIISYSLPEEYFRALQDGRLKMQDLPPDIAKLAPLFFKTTINSNCGFCHQHAFQKGQNQFENVLPENKDDPGYFIVTKKQEDWGKFKVPVLRNLPLTGPYMHDGSVPDIRTAINHYRAGAIKGGPDAYRDERGNIKTDPLTKERLDLYVEAFNVNIDKVIISDPRYSDPF